MSFNSIRPFLPHRASDPATHVTLARVPAMQAEDARAAIEAAEAAWEGWRNKTPKVHAYGKETKEARAFCMTPCCG